MAYPSLTPKAIGKLIWDSISAWMDDSAPRMGAAIAFYTVFSLAPILVIVISIAGLVFGYDAAQGKVMEQIQGLLGREGGEAVKEMLTHAHRSETGVIAALVGVVTLIITASAVFAELQSSLNAIWKVEAPNKGNAVLSLIKDRLLSFSVVAVIGFLLLVSLVVSSALAATGAYLNARFAGMGTILQVVNFVVSFAIVTALFAAIFKILPDTPIRWRDVWVGAAITAALFSIGKLLIGLYIGKSDVATGYGAAGSLVIILLWVYYSAQILLLGAEITRLYTERWGAGSKATAGADAAVSEAPAAEIGTDTTVAPPAYARMALGSAPKPVLHASQVVALGIGGIVLSVLRGALFPPTRRPRIGWTVRWR